MADEKFLFAREAQVVYEKRSIADGVRMKGSRVTDSKTAGIHIRHAIERHGEPMTERFVVLALDARQHVLGWQTVGVGTSTFCPVGVPEVLRFAILTGAVAIIVAEPGRSREHGTHRRGGEAHRDPVARSRHRRERVAVLVPRRGDSESLNALGRARRFQ